MHEHARLHPLPPGPVAWWQVTLSVTRHCMRASSTHPLPLCCTRVQLCSRLLTRRAPPPPLLPRHHTAPRTAFWAIASDNDFGNWCLSGVLCFWGGGQRVSIARAVGCGTGCAWVHMVRWPRDGQWGGRAAGAWGWVGWVESWQVWRCCSAWRVPSQPGCFGGRQGLMRIARPRKPSLCARTCLCPHRRQQETVVCGPALG